MAVAGGRGVRPLLRQCHRAQRARTGDDRVVDVRGGGQSLGFRPRCVGGGEDGGVRLAVRGRDLHGAALGIVPQLIHEEHVRRVRAVESDAYGRSRTGRVRGHGGAGTKPRKRKGSHRRVCRGDHGVRGLTRLRRLCCRMRGQAVARRFGLSLSTFPGGILRAVAHCLKRPGNPLCAGGPTLEEAGRNRREKSLWPAPQNLNRARTEQAACARCQGGTYRCVTTWCTATAARTGSPETVR